MKRIQTATLLFICLAGLFTVSCRKSPSWDSQILAPLITTSLSINNLVADSLVHANPDSSITLVYSGQLYNLNTDSLVKIPDTTLTYGYPQLFAHTYNPGDSIVIKTGSYTNYGNNSAQLRKATVESGFINIQVTSTIKGVTDFTYSIPSATLGGTPFTVTVKVPAAVGSTQGVFKARYPFNNYNIDFTGPSHNGYNTIYTYGSVILDPADAPTLVNSGDGIAVNASFDTIVPYYALGYFGSTSKSYTQTSPFSIFRKITSGSINLQNLNVSLTLQNGFGVDARVNITQLSGLNTHTGLNVNLTDAGIIGNTINVNRATQTYNPTSPVNPSIQTFNITPANSNILAWIDNLPNSVGYSVNVNINPYGNISGSNDFAYLGYGIQSNLNISMPLSLVANNLTLADTLAVNFSSTPQAQNVKSGTFTLYANNGFPFSAGLQIYLLDNTMKVVDSMMNTSQIITAGIINGSGIVTAPTASTISINLSETRTKTLLNTKHIIIMSRFNMGSISPLTYQKIYSYNTLSIKLVGNFDYLIKG